ncbi:glycosyltransferase family 4 protein [Candidatus Woesebacteria bacterium]|nr:glycosyltransferase family 4 protein [Candidatus Woesebacteria bacterium]
MKTIAILDPTSTDPKSSVRGIGRCLQTMKESLNNEPVSNSGERPVSQFSDRPISQHDNLYFNYLPNVTSLRKDMIFVNPFYNPVQMHVKIKEKHIKRIAIIHDLIPLKFKDHFPTGFRGMWNNYWNKRDIKKYDRIITVSDTSKKDIISIYNISSEKISVIYPTVIGLFLPHLDTSLEGPGHHHPFHVENNVVLPEFTRLPLNMISSNEQVRSLKDFAIYVGDATWNKNLPNLARAIKMTNITCVFVGKVFGDVQHKPIPKKTHPWEKSLYEFMQIAQNDPHFIFPGYVSDLELKLLYSHAKINMLVSYDEGFGYSYVEAGYMSTPSILADTPIFHEIAGEAATFANPHDPKDIAQKMNELYYDGIHHEKMSIRAFDRAQKYNPHKFQQDWFDVLSVI